MRILNRTLIHRFFFFLLILLLPTQLGYHFWPNWVLVLGRRVDYLSPTLYGTDILLVATIISWIFSSLQQKKIEIRTFTAPFSKKTLRILSLAGVLLVVNILFSRSPINSVVAWVKVGELCCLGYYIIKTRPNNSTVMFLLLCAT